MVQVIVFHAGCPFGMLLYCLARAALYRAHVVMLFVKDGYQSRDMTPHLFIYVDSSQTAVIMITAPYVVIGRLVR